MEGIGVFQKSLKGVPQDFLVKMRGNPFKGLYIERGQGVWILSYNVLYSTSHSFTMFSFLFTPISGQISAWCHL